MNLFKSSPGAAHDVPLAGQEPVPSLHHVTVVVDTDGQLQLVASTDTRKLEYKVEESKPEEEPDTPSTTRTK